MGNLQENVGTWQWCFAPNSTSPEVSENDVLMALGQARGAFLHLIPEDTEVQVPKPVSADRVLRLFSLDCAELALNDAQRRSLFVPPSAFQAVALKRARLLGAQVEGLREARASLIASMRSQGGLAWVSYKDRGYKLLEVCFAATGPEPSWLAASVALQRFLEASDDRSMVTLQMTEILLSRLCVILPDILSIKTPKTVSKTTIGFNAQSDLGTLTELEPLGDGGPCL